jgi:hypothetical protein
MRTKRRTPSRSARRRAGGDGDMALLSDSQRKAIQDAGRRDCRASLNPFEPDACAKAAWQEYWGSDWSGWDPPQAFLAEIIEYAWGWNWELQHFKDSWIGVPPDERR